jgi:curved DNA-binding protein CbpA
MDSEEDLYGILGVERGAPGDAIRAAYRARVRENHSDGKLLTPEETARADARTALLNHAWEVLSDPGRRRQYDEQRRLDALLRRAPAGNGEASPQGSADSRSAPNRSTQSIHASHLLRSRVMALPGLGWEKEACGGFEWALGSRTLLGRYLAALRYEESVDVEVARRFLSAVRVAAETRKARARHYLFVLMYDRVSQLEQVRTACAHFCAGNDGKGCGVVLYDAPRSRAQLSGPAATDEKTRGLLAALGV